MRVVLAIILCKLTRAGLRIIGRGGTALPGAEGLSGHSLAALAEHTYGYGYGH